MDKVGNNMFLTQEGFSSIDFTLLDRPSDSVMRASGSPGHIYTGAPPIQSIDYFNGARADPLKNQSYPEHGSNYISAALTGNGMKDLYGQRQRQGVHDFFGQDPDQKHLVLGNFSESNHPHYILPPSSSGNDQGDLSHSLNSMSGGESMETRKHPNDLIHMPITRQIQDRHHQASNSTQGIFGHFQNTQMKLRNPMPMSNGMSYFPQSSLKDLTGESVVQYHNQNGRYSSSSHGGDGVINDAKNYDFFESRLHWKSPSPAPSPSPSPCPSPAQAGLGQENQNSSRASGMTKLQLLQKHAMQVKKQQALEAQKQQAQKQHVVEAQDSESQKLQLQWQDGLRGQSYEAHIPHAQYHQRVLHDQPGFQSPNDLSWQGKPQQQLGFQSQSDQHFVIQSEHGFPPQNGEALSRVQQQGFQSQNGEPLQAQQQQNQGFQSQNNQTILRTQQQGFQSLNNQLLHAQQQQEQSFLRSQPQEYQSQIDQSVRVKHRLGSQDQTKPAMLQAQQQGFQSLNAQTLQSQQQGLSSQNDPFSGLQPQHQQGLQSQSDPSLQTQALQSQKDLFLKAQLQEQSFQSQVGQSLQIQQDFKFQNDQSLWVRHQERGVQSQNYQPSRAQQQQQGFQSQGDQPSREYQQQESYQSQNVQFLQNPQGLQSRHEQSSEPQQQGFQFLYEHSQGQRQVQGYHSQSDQSLRAQQQHQFENNQFLRVQQKQHQSQNEKAMRTQQQSFQPQQHEMWQMQQTQILKTQEQPKKQQSVESQQQFFQTEQIAMQTYQEPTLRSQVQPSVQPLQHLSMQSQQHLSMQPQPQHRALQHPMQSQVVPEPHLEFPETSYSALLHRPDTPPSQLQIGDETQLPESNQDLSFPDANMWAVDGASYYHGLPNNVPAGQNSSLTSRTLLNAPTLNQVRPVNAQAYFSEAHDMPTNHVNVGWRSFSNDSHLEKPMVYDGYAENVHPSELQTKTSGVRTVINNELNNRSTFSAAQQAQQLYEDSSSLKTDGLDVKNALNNENSNQSQMNLKLLTAQQTQQQTQQLRENSGLRNPVRNSTYNLNPLSQSQQHFQALQMIQERSPSSFEQRKNESDPSFSRVGDVVFRSSENGGNKIGNNGRGWNSSTLPQGCSFSPVDRHGEIENIQSPVDMASPSVAMTRSHIMPDQEILRSGLANGLMIRDGIVAPGFVKSPSLGPGRHTLEKYNSTNNFLTDAEKPSQLGRDGSSNSRYNALHHGNEGETAFGSGTPIRNPSIGNSQGMVGQQVRGKQFPIMNGMNQETQGQTASQQSGNVLKVPVSRPTGKLMSGAVDDSLALLQKNSGHMGEALQQKIDSSVSSISLTQDWQSQSSHPTSPQHVKLALGPSNLSQISQQGERPSWRNLNHIQAIAEGVTTTHSTGRSLHVDSLYSSAAIGGASNHQVESSQVSDISGKKVILQTGPAADISKKWTPTKDSTPSDVLPPKISSFGHGLLTKPTIISRHMTPSASSFIEGVEGSQREIRVGASSFPGFQQVRDDSRTSVSLIGQSLPTTDFSRHPNYESGSLHEMQNQHIINMALKQLENKEQARGSVGLATNLKKPPPEQPKSLDMQDKAFLGSVPMVKAREICDDSSKRETGQMFQRPQTGNLGLVSSEVPSLLKLNTESQNNQFRIPHQEKASTLQTSGLAATNSMVLERRPFSVVDSSRGNLHLQGERPLYGQNNFQFSNAMDSTPSQADIMATGFERHPAFVSHGQSVGQHLQIRAKAPEATVADPTERKDTFLKPGGIPTNYVYSGKVSLNQQSDINSPIIRQHRSMLELNEVAAQSEETAKYAPEMLLKQPIGNIVVGTSLCSYKEKDEDVTPKDAKLVSVAHRGKPTDLLSQAQAFKYGPSSLYENSSISVQNISSKEQAQVGSFSNQGTPRLEDATELRERVNEISGTTPAKIISSQLPLETSNDIVTLDFPKKKKKQIPLLIPWHLMAVEPSSNLLSSGEAELIWATATNRVPDKENMNVLEDMSDEARAKKRIKLTTQLMQQIFSPLLINGNNTHVDNECTIYSVTRVTLGDACKLAMSSEREASDIFDTKKSNDDAILFRHLHGCASMAKAVQYIESFMGKAKRLDDEITRSAGLTTAMELKAETHELEKMAIVNRLAMQHGKGFAMDSSSLSSPNLVIGNNHISDIGSGLFANPIPTPEKYVTVAPMPRTLPDHAKCLSL